MSPTSQAPSPTAIAELKHRIEARRDQLRARLAELEADARHEAAVARAQMTLRIDQLDAALKDGWDEVSDAVRARLEAWLADG